MKELKTFSNLTKKMLNSISLPKMSMSVIERRLLHLIEAPTERRSWAKVAALVDEFKDTAGCRRGGSARRN